MKQIFHPRGRSRPTTRSAFTLTELLVVIATISILVTLLVPSLTGARNKVQGIACQNNLRQWGLATLLYVNDHDDHLPYDGSPNGISKQRAWYVDLPLQIGQRPYHEQGPWRTNPEVLLPRTLWLCPRNSQRSSGFLLFHYCLNRHISGSGDDSFRPRYSLLPNPSQLVWLYDNGQRAAVASIRNVHTNLHNKGAHILFLDGHVSYHPRAHFWDERGREPRYNHPDLDWNFRP